MLMGRDKRQKKEEAVRQTGSRDQVETTVRVCGCSGVFTETRTDLKLNSNETKREKKKSSLALIIANSAPDYFLISIIK